MIKKIAKKYRSTDVVPFNKMIESVQHGKSLNQIKSNQRLLTLCASLDPFVDVVYAELDGLRKFHVYIRKYINIAIEHIPGTPIEVFLGKNRRPFTFPSLRSYALFFYNSKLVRQYRHIMYVPKLPKRLMLFEPWRVNIEWKSDDSPRSREVKNSPRDRRDSSSEYSDCSSGTEYRTDEDSDFECEGWDWGDIAMELQERRERRAQRKKKKNY